MTSEITSRALNRHLRKFHPRTQGGGVGGGGGFALSTLGCFIHLAATPGQTIPSGGTLLEFSAFETLQHNNWDTQLPALPADEIGIPLRRYYDILVVFKWDTWDEGGTVIINRTRSGVTTPVWPPVSDALVGRWSSALTGTDTFVGIAKGISLEIADTISVSVDSGDAGDQDIVGGYMTIESVEEGGPEIPQDLFIFLEDGTFDWALAGSPATLRDVWIIGGGGAGGGGVSGWDPGGGGGGGVNHLTDYAVSGDVAVTVGQGGSAAEDDGEGSSFDGQVAPGGGSGGHDTTSANGSNGGCGGGGAGGAVTDGTGGTGSHGQDGGDGDASDDSGGGGGGYSTPGGNGGPSSGGDGGDGIDLSAIVGTGYGDAGWFAGGGGGWNNAGPGSGGQGGGADAGASNHAAPNTGGGGGAGEQGGDEDFGAGGSGIVIVRVR